MNASTLFITFPTLIKRMKILFNIPSIEKHPLQIYLGHF